MFVALARGHYPGRGAEWNGRQEYRDLPGYLMPLEAALRARGVEVARIGGTTLAGQQGTGIALIGRYLAMNPGAGCLFVAAHLNSGGVDYQRSVPWYDYRSARGRKLADALTAGGPVRTYSRVAEPGSRALPCIERVYATPASCCGVLIEALSLDREPYGACLLSQVAEFHAEVIAGFLGG